MAIFGYKSFKSLFDKSAIRTESGDFEAIAEESIRKDFVQMFRMLNFETVALRDSVIQS